MRSPIHRPRVEGEREQEILDATRTVLIDTGYDRLTMDAVAKAAKASKATLYRRWSSKAALVVDSLCAIKQPPAVPDTGTLRGDLIALFTAMHTDSTLSILPVFGGVLTALSTDAELSAEFRDRFIAPRSAASHTVYVRAQARGEIRPELDLDLLEPALPGILLHRGIVLGEQITPDLVSRVIDQIILPAVTLQETP